MFHCGLLEFRTFWKFRKCTTKHSKFLLPQPFPSKKVNCVKLKSSLVSTYGRTHEMMEKDGKRNCNDCGRMTNFLHISFTDQVG